MDLARAARWTRDLDAAAAAGRLLTRTVVLVPLVLVAAAVLAGAGFLLALAVGLARPEAPGRDGVLPYDVLGPYVGALVGAALGLVGGAVVAVRSRRSARRAPSS